MTPHGTVDVEIHSLKASIVTLYGEHDLNSREQLDVALGLASVCPSLLVDISAVTFVDSTLICCLLNAAAHARKRGGKLELVIARDTYIVRRALEIAGVETLVTFHETRAAGVASIAAVEPRSGAPTGFTVVRAEVADADEQRRAA